MLGYRGQVVAVERKVEKRERHHHSGRGEREGDRPTSPTRSPPVSPTHMATFDPKHPQPKKKHRKF